MKFTLNILKNKSKSDQASVCGMCNVVNFVVKANYNVLYRKQKLVLTT